MSVISLRPERPAAFVCVALLVRVIAFRGCRPLSEMLSTFVGCLGGDTPTYINSVENLINQGHYAPDYRMPGYGAPYFLFRLVLSAPFAQNAMVVLQLLLGAISTYLLAMLVYRLTRSVTAFAVAFALYSTAVFVTVWDAYLLTESLSASVLILFVYFAHAARRQSVPSLYWLAGLLGCWAVFLKPVLLPVIGFLLGLYIAAASRERRRYAAVALLTPLLLLDGLWVARNLVANGELRPLNNGFYAPGFADERMRALIPFLQAWGGDFVWWNPTADILWFRPSMKRVDAPIVPPPAFVMNEDLTPEAMQRLRRLLMSSDDPSLSESERAANARVAAAELRHYTEVLRKQHPLTFHIVAPLRILKKYVLHSGTNLLFPVAYADLPQWQRVVKIVLSIEYLGTIALGCVGLIVLLVIDGDVFLRLSVAALGLYLLLVYPLGLRFAEARYLVPGYPFIAIAATVSGFAIIRTFAARREPRPS